MSARIRCPSERVRTGVLDKVLQIQDFIQKSPCACGRASLEHHKSPSKTV